MFPQGIVAKFGELRGILCMRSSEQSVTSRIWNGDEVQEECNPFEPARYNKLKEHATDLSKSLLFIWSSQKQDFETLDFRLREKITR